MSKKVQSNSVQQQNSLLSRITRAAIILVIIVGAWLLGTQQQAIRDYYRLQTFSVDDVVATIAQRTTLTPRGEQYFYMSHPELLDKETFNTKCERREADNPILGCYTADQAIYLFNIQSDELDGIVDVTAAHEMLHAAWDRLSSKERTQLEAQLVAAYESLDDADLKRRMEYYGRQEPEARTNELHSILGTEISNLPAELEEYYAQYFSRRSAVVDLYKSYQSVFDSITERSEDISGKLATMKPAIEQAVREYNADAAALAKSFDRLEADRDAVNRNDGAAVAAFNERVQSLNNQAQALRIRREAINADINEYNKLAAELNEINLENNELTASIDSLAVDD